MLLKHFGLNKSSESIFESNYNINLYKINKKVQMAAIIFDLAFFLPKRRLPFGVARLIRNY